MWARLFVHWVSIFVITLAIGLMIGLQLFRVEDADGSGHALHGAWTAKQRS